jgi:hypothetical protein
MGFTSFRFVHGEFFSVVVGAAHSDGTVELRYRRGKALLRNVSEIVDRQSLYAR